MPGFLHARTFLRGLGCLISLLLLHVAKAQVPGCRIRHFDINNGLPQNSITGLAFDKQHFLWVGTQGGLTKYDGLTFVRIEQSKLSSRIKKVFNTYDGEVFVEDDKYNLLVSKVGLSIFYDLLGVGGEERYSVLNARLFGPRFNTLYYDSMLIKNLANAGKISWSSTKRNAFLGIKLSGNSLLLGDKAVMELNSFVPGKQGFIGEIFLSINNNHQIIAYDCSNASFRSINWVASADSQVNLDDFMLNAFWVEGSGKLYALYNGTFYGIALRGDALWLTPFFSKLPPIVDINYAVYDEAAALLAIGTGTNGLYLAQPLTFRSITAGENAPERFKKEKYDNFTSLLWTSGGELIADNGFRYGKKMEPWIHPDSILPLFLNQDALGRIWYTNSSGDIVVLNDDYTLFKRINGNLVKGGILQTHADTFWLNYNKNISRLSFNRRSDTFTVDYKKEINIRGEATHKYRLDSLHFLFCGTRGLYKYNWRTNQLLKIKHSNEYNFRSMVKSPGGNVYVNTYGNGYFLYRGDSLIALPLDKNEYLRYPHTFVCDSLGFAWISTNNGLFQVKESDLLAFANGQVEDIYFHYYDETYGFKTNEFNGGGFQSGLIAPNGNIYLASMKGLVIFNPYSIKPILPESPIYIQDASVDGIKIVQLEDLTLKKGFKNLKLKIQTPFYGHPDNLNFSYRIVGFNNSWNKLSRNSELGVQTLKGGEYILEFRKLNGFGKNNYSYKRIKFTVEPFFYERPVFYVILFITFGLCIYIYFRYRTFNFKKIQKNLEAEVQHRTIALNENLRELKSKNEELGAKTDMLNTVYGVVTHDLISPLRFLHRAVLRLNEMPQTEMKKQIDIIAQTTSHTEKFVHGLLVWIKLNQDAALANLEKITPTELIENNVKLFLWLANDRGVELRNDSPAANTPIWISVELVSTLIRNFLDNALKYTSKGSISIKAYVEADTLNIFIEDTGRGMAPDIVQQINAKNTPYVLTLKNYMGMKIIFDILNILKGELNIQSELRKGTIVHLKIPVLNELEEVMNEQV
jgi:signal transduction histidine kinase